MSFLYLREQVPLFSTGYAAPVTLIVDERNSDLLQLVLKFPVEIRIDTLVEEDWFEEDKKLKREEEKVE